MSATAEQQTPAQKLESEIAREEQEAAYQREAGKEDQAAAHDEEVTRLRAELDQLQPAQAEPEEDDLLPAELIVAGLEQLGKFNAGGKSPTSATLKFSGMSVKLQEGTAFRKGQTIKFTGTAVVNFVGQQDTHDSETGQVTDAQQQHKARLVDLNIEGL